MPLACDRSHVSGVPANPIATISHGDIIIDDMSNSVSR